MAETANLYYPWKNGDFQRNIGPIGQFSQKHWLKTQNISSFFNAAHQTLLSVSCGPQDTLSLRPLVYRIGYRWDGQAVPGLVLRAVVLCCDGVVDGNPNGDALVMTYLSFFNFMKTLYFNKFYFTKK